MNNISHLVKSEDLNHHGTLFAGKVAEWFVEATYIEANLAYRHPENLVCLKIHGLKFVKPIKSGSIVNIKTSLAYTGRTSIMVYGKIYNALKPEDVMAEGFVTFISVDEEGKKQPHNINFVPQTEEEKEIYQKALDLRKNELQGQ
ncbi:MAG: acyl-CoA thioesterase [Mesoaciditoga sp.]|uniref:acyl-CoA thioesterase n=1 Tax=Athalassotoga sp. TaxID=2022597 RepID=UPI000CA90585|nr:MAG: acyl-CoA thioesterase [Mesoaciditoga sp.]HEU23506.1 acyl-CoA thioesterase [Mesoaciditoga lauensis]